MMSVLEPWTTLAASVPGWSDGADEPEDDEDEEDDEDDEDED